MEEGLGLGASEFGRLIFLKNGVQTLLEIAPNKGVTVLAGTIDLLGQANLGSSITHDSNPLGLRVEFGGADFDLTLGCGVGARGVAEVN